MTQRPANIIKSYSTGGRLKTMVWPLQGLYFNMIECVWDYLDWKSKKSKFGGSHK